MSINFIFSKVYVEFKRGVRQGIKKSLGEIEGPSSQKGQAYKARLIRISLHEGERAKPRMPNSSKKESPTRWEFPRAYNIGICFQSGILTSFLTQSVDGGMRQRR
jgi:hypothetical protein